MLKPTLRTMATGYLAVTLILLMICCCHGDQDKADHLLLLERLPNGISIDTPTFLDVRTNFSGTVRVVSSSEFRVVVNVSAVDLETAYTVQADLDRHGDGMLLQVSQRDTTAGAITLMWLVLAVAGATTLVLVITSLYVFCWYRSERSLYDLAEKKSVAGSSQRGVYRSRNSLQVVNLPPLHDLPLPYPPGDGDHNDDTLRQVPEMPEEEAEAIEMEELTLLKLKELDHSDPTANESDPPRLTSQERNLVKNQPHAGSKNVHKDLLKDKPSAAKANVRPPAKHPQTRRRTAGGLYIGLTSNPGSADESVDTENDTDLDVTGESVSTVSEAVDPPSYESCQSRPPMTSFMSPQRHVRQPFPGRTSTPTSSLEASQRDPVKPDNLSRSNQDGVDSGLQVLADVHKTGPTNQQQPEIVKVTTPERPSHPGFGGLSPDTPRQTLVTFSPPAAPPARQSRAIRFKEPGDDVDSPTPTPTPAQHQPPPLAPKPNGNQNPMSPGVRFPPGFSGMVDIPEDPREDCDSALSESGRSRSLYGSSEIFEAHQLEPTYYNLVDSDLDIPPLDTDDMLSDGGLPSPLTASLGRGATRDDCSVPGGQRAVFFGRDSPLGGVPRPRPYSSIILRSTTPTTTTTSSNGRAPSDSGVSSGISSDQTTPVHSDKDSVSPLLPPPPLPLEDASVEGSAFRFPSPPRFFPGQDSGKGTSEGEYVTLPNNSVRTGGPGRTGGHEDGSRHTDPRGRYGGGGRLGGGSTFTNLTLLSVTCLLALTTGVYSRLTADDGDTRVDITVFAPPSFLARTSTVYFHVDRDTHIVIDGNFTFEAYVTPEPVLTEGQAKVCMPGCHADQACDRQTGQCICHKGYRMVDQGICIDINECAEGFTSCHPSAGCLNRKGSYDCVCSVDYYGDGQTCHDCNTPCSLGQYEVQPCSKTSQKICKECTSVCYRGYYKASQCTEFHNAQCRVCQPPCQPGEYEYRTCSNYHDRQCKNITQVPSVDASENVILEEDRKVKESKVTIEHLRSLSVGYTRYSLDRGTGLTVDISLQNMEAAQQFSPLSVAGGTPSPPPSLLSPAVRRLCPHPVPDHYILHYTKHTDVTYTLDDVGQIQPCHTNQTHGKFPEAVLKKDNSFLCRQPGALTKMFEIPTNVFQTASHWAEKSKRCETLSGRCEQCTRRCAQQMVGGSNDCSVVGDNSDNGWSPRLRVCFNCCARDNCTDDCQHYHRRRCQPLRCHHGNLVEFSVFPSWKSNGNGKFFCHIRPVAKQRLLEMRYIVRQKDRPEPVLVDSITVEGGEAWEQHGRTVHKGKLLDIVIDSHLGSLPDFLEGRVGSDGGEFHVGSYTQRGSRVDTSVISGESVRIHPLRPFGLNFSTTDPHRCDNAVVKDAIIAGEHQPPYSPNHDMMAVASRNNTPPFSITRIQQPPTVHITADRRPFLRGIFRPAALRPGSLGGDMRQNASHWTVRLTGQVEECPGYLRVVVSDPAYRTTSLFSCDVAVTCPPTFHLYFHLPSADTPGLDRQMEITVADRRKLHHLRLNRPAKAEVVGQSDRQSPPASIMMPSPVKKSGETSRLSLPEGFIFSIPYMVSVGGAICLLLCLLVIGLIVQPGVPAPEPPILQCHHALFVVIYFVFHFLYSVVITSSVFFLVVMAVNSPRVAFIQQHQRQAAASCASHQLELTSMQTFLERELGRQARHLDSMRSVCRHHMGLIMADMNKMHLKLLREMEDSFHKHKLESLLEQHRHRSMLQLSQDLLSFRDQYSQVVGTMLQELNHNIEQSRRSVENNTWLAGARFLHGVVTTTRRHINNVDTKSFMDWANLNADLSKLTVDASFTLPHIPKLADIEDVIESKVKDEQPTKRSQQSDDVDKLRTSYVHNRWFSHFTHNGTANILWQRQAQQRRSRESASFRVFYILLGMLGCVDLILIIHRVLKAKIVAQLLLYGFPEYMDFRERKDVGDDDAFEDERRCCRPMESPFCQAVKVFLSQVMSSTFLPKAVLVVATALLLRATLYLSASTLTVESLRSTGLYYSSEDYLDLHGQLINGRLQAHAHHVNTIDFPAYQTFMSAFIQRHHFTFQVYEQQLRRMQRAHTQSYCQYLQALDLAGNCSIDEGDNSSHAHGIISPGCQFQPVLPQLYKRSESVYRNLSSQQLSMVLENLRAIVFDTCQVVVVFLSVIVLKELLCAVVWIFIRRSGLIRLRIIYETDTDDPAPTG